MSRVCAGFLLSFSPDAAAENWLKSPMSPSECPPDSTPEIQEFHLPIYHALCIALEARFFTTS
jgi:hypothetical protein